MTCRSSFIKEAKLHIQNTTSGIATERSGWSWRIHGQCNHIRKGHEGKYRTRSFIGSQQIRLGFASIFLSRWLISPFQALFYHKMLILDFLNNSNPCFFCHVNGQCCLDPGNVWLFVSMLCFILMSIGKHVFLRKADPFHWTILTTLSIR